MKKCKFQNRSQQKSQSCVPLSVCSALAKNTKWRISAPIINKNKFFSPVPKSPDHTCLLYVKNLPSTMTMTMTSTMTKSRVSFFT